MYLQGVLEFSILVFSAALTSIISALTGMTGGILLLSVMTFFLPFQALIPIHGIVQLMSNSSRALILRYSIHWGMFLPFLIGAPFGALGITYWIGQVQDTRWALTAIALLIFYAVFKPKRLPHLKIPFPAFFGVGFIAGGLGMVVGATGPFLAPFFLRGDLAKEQIVATKASMQLFVHLLKIPAFLYLGFAYREYALLIISMSAAVILGTAVGVRGLRHLTEQVFQILFRTLLVIAALRLLWKSWGETIFSGLG